MMVWKRRKLETELIKRFKRLQRRKWLQTEYGTSFSSKWAVLTSATNFQQLNYVFYRPPDDPPTTQLVTDLLVKISHYATLHFSIILLLYTFYTCCYIIIALTLKYTAFCGITHEFSAIIVIQNIVEYHEMNLIPSQIMN